MKYLVDLKEIAEIFKKYNVQYRLSTTSNEAYSYSADGFVFLGTKGKGRDSKARLLSTIFHEIAHCLNYRNKKYLTYHDTKRNGCTYPSVKFFKWWRYAKRHGLAAERYTDRLGQKLMKQHYPSLKYEPGYKYKWQVEAFKYLINHKVNKMLAKREKER